MSSSPAFASTSHPQSTFWASLAGDLSDQPPGQSTPLQHTSASFDRRPRLSSPRLFSQVFTLPPPSAPTRTQLFRQPSDFRDTVNDINRALESANTAIQDAQDAFVVPETRNIREHTFTMPPVVDLTTASPSQSPEMHRHDARSPRQHSHIMTLLNDLPPGYDPNLQFSPIDLSGTGRLPRVRSFLDYDPDRSNGHTQRRPRADRAHQRQEIGDPFSLFPARPRLDLQEREQQAIQRQREARALWDSNQGRREALVPRTSRSRSPRRSSPPVRQRSEDDGRPESSGFRAKSESTVESIDLTAVDEKTSASDILAKQREDAVASQRRSSETGRTTLTSYKCPICMETPTDATATVCGHLFCHRCIWETLRWSEEQRAENMPHLRPKGVCPVCRKELKRIDTDEKGRTLVPLNLKLRDQIRGRHKEDLKGKGVARDVSDQESKIRESSSEWIGRLVNLDGT